MKKLVFLLFLFVGIVFGQKTPQIKLSSEATFSVVTCGAGSELYSSFGHSAFRLKDPVYGYDVVYNYGTFDFNTPFFYIKFAQGKLPYQLGRSSFKNFVRIYQYEKRWIKEQVLNLTPEQNKTLLAYLENNYKEENRDYKYDFFYNNCATKIRDVIKENFGDNIIFHEDHLPKDKTFRDLIHDNLEANSWSSFGIDIALGAVIDKPAYAEEYQFLPEYVFKAFENATMQDSVTPFVTETNLVLDAPETTIEKGNIIFSPYVIFTIFLLIVLIITFLDFKNNKRTRWLDAILLLVNGLTGIILLLLWFATDHTATAMNMNVLWLLPINIFFVRKFFLKSKECKSLAKHTAFCILLMLVVFFLWIIDFQQFALAAIPLMALFLVRYLYLTYYFGKLDK
ncbi:DUF4105 domain-containing protein [Kordia algicida OT-1]|uniref:Uncharacterized protein n=1 Tax=Kordia algicida OT-1 TaxID=391587 RepID=A9EBN4_9FLAO|nr:DUF4105 domain-containing protein [Kordia algicida]EDP94497.1 hypothetical protein KAOT1_06157 [Kordia algicida OT-1]